MTLEEEIAASIGSLGVIYADASERATALLYDGYTMPVGWPGFDVRTASNVTIEVKSRALSSPTDVYGGFHGVEQKTADLFVFALWRLGTTEVLDAREMDAAAVRAGTRHFEGKKDQEYLILLATVMTQGRDITQAFQAVVDTL